MKSQKTFVIKDKFKIHVELFEVNSEVQEDPEIKEHVDFYVQKQAKEMEKVVGYTSEPLDTRFSILRTEETNFGNFYADVIRKEV